MVFALIDPTSYHTHSSDLDATFTRVATARRSAGRLGPRTGHRRA